MMEPIKTQFDRLTAFAIRTAKQHPRLRRWARSRFGRWLRLRLFRFIPRTAADRQYESARIDCIEERKQLYPAQAVPGLLSITTTAYNTPIKYLRVLADSVLTQDDSDFEWLILDNGSTDQQTIRLLDELAEHDSVTLFHVRDNLGIIGGNRYLLERATGRYILPVDSDDYLYPDAVRIMAWFIQEREYPPLLYSNEDRLTEQQFHDPFFKPDWDPVYFVNLCYIAHLCAIDRRLALELNLYDDESCNGSHDWDSFMRFYTAGYEPIHIPEILYGWRLHRGSCSLDVGSKSYVNESHHRVLGKFLSSRGQSDRFSIEPNPLFDGTPNWHIRRDQGVARPSVTVVLCSDSGNAAAGKMRDDGDTVFPLSIDDSAHVLESLIQKNAERNGLVHLIHESVASERGHWMQEVCGLMELFEEIVAIGGRVCDSRNKIVAAGEFFGADAKLVCPDVGRSIEDPGYYSSMYTQHTVSAVPSLLAVYDARFLQTLLKQEAARKAPLKLLGAYAGAHARRTGQRVVYTPFLTGRTDLDWYSTIHDDEWEAFAASNADVSPDSRWLSQPLLENADCCNSFATHAPFRNLSRAA